MTILVTMISIPFMLHVPTLENIITITFDKRMSHIFHVSQGRLTSVQQRVIVYCWTTSLCVLFIIDPCPADIVLFIIDPCPAESVLLDQRFPLCSHQRDSGLLGASLFPPTPPSPSPPLPPSLPHPSSAHTTTPPSPPPSPPHTTGHP